MVQGRGAHGATPQFSRDPIVAGSAIVSSLQALVARETDPVESAVREGIRREGSVWASSLSLLTFWGIVVIKYFGLIFGNVFR